MKIIFLDIDGVLNHEAFYKERFERRYEEGAIPYPYSEIDKNSVLCTQTNAKVVISSSWRHSGLEFCKEVLENSGFTGDIIDITPDLPNNPRGNEIHKWITDNETSITRYIILDDDYDMMGWQKDHFIQIDRFVGLTLDDVEKATNILTKELN